MQEPYSIFSLSKGGAERAPMGPGRLLLLVGGRVGSVARSTLLRWAAGSTGTVSYYSAIKPALCYLPFGPAAGNADDFSVLATLSTSSTSSSIAFLAACSETVLTSGPHRRDQIN